MEKQQRQSVSDSLSSVTDGVKRLGRLYIRKARLKTTEKLTILLSTIAFAAVIAALALVLVLFITIGVGHLLATSIAPHLAYLIVAAFYLILLVVVLMLRRPLFIDPIARFISRLLVEAPDDEHSNNRNSSHPHSNSDSTEQSVVIDYDILAQRVISAMEKKSAEIEKEVEEELSQEEEIQRRIEQEFEDSNNREGGES